MSKEIIAGVAGGLVGAGLARLTTPPPKDITATKRIIESQTVEPGAAMSLMPVTRFKFAIILFHGDGDPYIRLDIEKPETTIYINGNEQGVEILANEAIAIVAANTNPGSSGNTPTIEIVALSW